MTSTRDRRFSYLSISVWGFMSRYLIRNEHAAVSLLLVSHSVSYCFNCLWYGLLLTLGLGKRFFSATRRKACRYILPSSPGIAETKGSFAFLLIHRGEKSRQTKNVYFSVSFISFFFFTGESPASVARSRTFLRTSKWWQDPTGEEISIEVWKVSVSRTGTAGRRERKPFLWYPVGSNCWLAFDWLWG